ncbi:MAG: TetR family transcriptional regulator [Gemmatimonadota bacterium]
MAEPMGRREANKQATRAALTAAAKRLFAERGYEATTVADIASAANVTHRTFYRYFDGKEDLIAGEWRAWLAVLQEAITARPPAEPPLTALRHAMASAAAQAPMSPFASRPLASLRQAGQRPLLRLESAVADAIAARLEAAAGSTAGTGGAIDFQADVIARVAVAALRSAVIRHRELRKGGDPAPPGLDELLGQAFAIVSGL